MAPDKSLGTGWAIYHQGRVDLRGHRQVPRPSERICHNTKSGTTRWDKTANTSSYSVSSAANCCLSLSPSSFIASASAQRKRKDARASQSARSAEGTHRAPTALRCRAFSLQAYQARFFHGQLQRWRRSNNPGNRSRSARSTLHIRSTAELKEMQGDQNDTFRSRLLTDGTLSRSDVQFDDVDV